MGKDIIIEEEGKRDVKTIGKHINNALREELAGEPVVAKFATPKKYGRRDGFEQIQYPEYYSLEMITSVGFRVKSKNGIVFRRWANTVLKTTKVWRFATRPGARPSTPLMKMRWTLSRKRAFFMKVKILLYYDFLLFLLKNTLNLQINHIIIRFL